MQEIVLVRHAAATGQHPDAPLSAEGQRQALQLADALQQLRVARVVASPFRRAIESAEPFCQRAGIVLETDARLTEHVLNGQDLVDWREQLRRSFDDLDRCLEGGESSRAAQARGVAAVLAAAGSQRCAVVTHGKLLSLILRWASADVGYDFWAQLSNPDVYILRLTGDGTRAFHRAWG